MSTAPDESAPVDDETAIDQDTAEADALTLDELSSDRQTIENAEGERTHDPFPSDTEIPD